MNQASNDRALPSAFLSPAHLSGLAEDTPILVAYSGGADSTALLHMLSRYGKENGARICAAHLNHGIRGEEADRDEAFCRGVAEKLGIVFFSRRVDVPALAKEWKESIETAARRARYLFFDEVMVKEEIPLLATAHNADDNLETMLFHLIRGSGLGGLVGIPVSRSCEGGTLVRPLLRMTKGEILAYCRAFDLTYVTDSTNTNTDYTRNRLRAEVIPPLRQINSAAVSNAARLAERLQEDALCLDSMTSMFLEGLRRGDGIETEKLNGSPAAIVNRALMALYREVSGGGVLEYTHIAALRRLSQRSVPHSRVTLPGGWEAMIEEGLLLFRPMKKKAIPPSYSLPLLEGRNPISQTNCEIVIGPSQKTKNIYKKSILLSIDSATIKGCLSARSRLPGDRIRMGGMSRNLKKLMCEKKLPIELRARLPVICDEEGIVAVPCVGIRDGAAPAGSPLELYIEFS